MGSVTIGSNLNRVPALGFAGSNTLINSGMPGSYQAPGGLTSPVNGTVTLWRLLSTSSGTAGFQVVHPLGGGLFTGAGSTPEFVVPGNMVSTYALAMPIKIGDYIGLRTESSGLHVATSDPAAHFIQWQPPLQDGTGSMPGTDFSGNELTFNADIAPSNTFTLGAIARDKTRGKATLTIVVPNPGELSASGKGAKVSSIARASKSVTAPGPVPLVIKATGKQGKTLNRAGKVKLRVTLSFTPTGGTAASLPVKVKLKKRL